MINRKILKDTIKFLLVAILLVFVTKNIVRIAYIDGNSMLNAYKDRDIVLLYMMDKNYQTGEVVAFTYTDEVNRHLPDPSIGTEYVGGIHAKRIIGLPGDKIKVKDKKTYVNDSIVSVSSKELLDGEYYLDEDEYFVQGDNIDGSFDSRFHGPIIKKDIIGKVIPQKPADHKI